MLPQAPAARLRDSLESLILFFVGEQIMTESEATSRWQSLSMEEQQAAWLTRHGFTEAEIAVRMNCGPDEARQMVERACARLGAGDPLALALSIVYHRLELRPAPQESAAPQVLQLDAG